MTSALSRDDPVPRHNSIRAEVERSAHGVVHRPLSFVGRERQSASAPSPTSSTDSIAAPLLILGWVLSSPLRGYSARAETLASLAVHPRATLQSEVTLMNKDGPALCHPAGTIRKKSFHHK